MSSNFLSMSLKLLHPLFIYIFPISISNLMKFIRHSVDVYSSEARQLAYRLLEFMARGAGVAASRVRRADPGHEGELLPAVPAAGWPGAGPDGAHRRVWPDAAAADEPRRAGTAGQERRQVVRREGSRRRLHRQRRRRPWGRWCLRGLVRRFVCTIKITSLPTPA